MTRRAPRSVWISLCSSPNSRRGRKRAGHGCLAKRRAGGIAEGGHHGSRSSTTPAFLTAAAPKDAFVSVGKENTFGHPRSEVIERIARNGTKLYGTDEFGIITFLLNQEGSTRELTGAAAD